VPFELFALGIPHVAFVIWIVYADRAMRRQRSIELERFRQLKP
jgi:hypothetical protein